MRRKKLAQPQVLDPLRGCQFCGGSGWVKTLVAPPSKAGPSGQVIYDPPSVRCSCTKPARRDQVEPLPPALDQAQRAAGERPES